MDRFMEYFLNKLTKKPNKPKKEFQIEFSDLDKKRLRNATGREKEKLTRELKHKYDGKNK
jgi:hypothetical protein